MWENLPALKLELEIFEQAMQAQFNTIKINNSYLDKLSLNVIKSGGKRLRPAMMFASAMLGEYDRSKVLHAAMSIELLHTATLVHDDIIDNAKIRRNSPTIYARKGVNTAIFVGDYIYVKSILALAEANLPIMYLRELAKAIEAICIGEVEQFRSRGTIPTFRTYLSRITRKTGVLFAASCAIGARLSGLSEDLIKRAARFGGYYGIAFQIRDDLMDIIGNPKTIGKPVGNDLKEGIITLPILLAGAKNQHTRKHLELFLNAFDKKRPSNRDVSRLLNDVVKADGVNDAEVILKKYIDKARHFLQKLPDTPGKDMLSYILKFTFIDFIGDKE
ncbi:MAG: polyprenyl synthetase family protein [Christensenellales bacterium]